MSSRARKRRNNQKKKQDKDKDKDRGHNNVTKKGKEIKESEDIIRRSHEIYFYSAGIVPKQCFNTKYGRHSHNDTIYCCTVCLLDCWTSLEMMNYGTLLYHHCVHSVVMVLKKV